MHSRSLRNIVITERWPGAKRYRNAFEVVRQNVIDIIAEGKHLEPRQAITQIKTGLQSTLRNMQGDEDQQNECSRILTDMAGERIALEQEMLFPMGTPYAGSEFGMWEHTRGYGSSPQDVAASRYDPFCMDGNITARIVAASQFLTDGLYNEHFDVDDLSKIMYD